MPTPKPENGESRVSVRPRAHGRGAGCASRETGAKSGDSGADDFCLAAAATRRFPGADDDAANWPAWRDAAGLPAIDAAIRALYADLDATVQARGPTCWLSGRCCNFDAFGHRLYVTGLEIAWVVKQVGAIPSDRHDGSCPFQKDKLCTVHAVRPLGCRIFFCQKGTQSWQQDLYEQFLSRLRALHDQHQLPYRYMEWRAGLAAATTVFADL